MDFSTGWAADPGPGTPESSVFVVSRTTQQFGHSFTCACNFVPDFRVNGFIQEFV